MAEPTSSDLARTREWTETAIVLVAQADELEITDQSSLDQATTFLGGVQALTKEIHAFMDPLVQSAWEHHRVLTGRRGELLEGPQRAERIVKGKLVDHERQQRAAREAAEARQREDIRRQQEAEQLRRVAEAERNGDAARARRIAEGPPPPVLVAPVQPTGPQTQARGVTYREHWTARVTDLRALAAAVAEGRVPLEYILPNASILDQVARGLKEALRVPGVEPVKELVAAGTGARR